MYSEILALNSVLPEIYKEGNVLNLFHSTASVSVLPFFLAVRDVPFCFLNTKANKQNALFPVIGFHQHINKYLLL